MASTRAKPELRTVTIAIVRDGAEVQTMQSKLKSAGIESFLTSERSYVVKKSPDLAVRHAAPPGKEKGAVKVQVARSDVQRALSVLGAAHVAAPPAPCSLQVAPQKTRKVAPRLLRDRDPTVPIIVVVFVLVAALILSIS
jgi:hypothetical protein